MSFDVDQIRTANPLMQVIERETGSSFKRVGNWWFTLCPFHHEKTPSFAMKHEDATHYTCFGGCERKTGDVIDFIQQLRGVTFQEACAYLGGSSDVSEAELAIMKQAREAERASIEAQESQELAQRRANLDASGLYETFHQNLDDEARQWWWNETRLPPDWQDYWNLGYVPDLWSHGPAYSIPYRSMTNHVLTIQYRFKVPNGLGKYRFEPDLGAPAFIARPGMKARNILVVEGAKKAMVTYLRGLRASEKMQVIGIPSQNSLGDALPLLRQAEKVWVWLDPDSWNKPKTAGNNWAPWPIVHARAIGPKTRVVRLHLKIDDAILAGLEPDAIARILNFSRGI